jgi:hypothetical protein
MARGDSLSIPRKGPARRIVVRGGTTKIRIFGRGGTLPDRCWRLWWLCWRKRETDMPQEFMRPNPDGWANVTVEIGKDGVRHVREESRNGCLTAPGSLLYGVRKS